MLSFDAGLWARAGWPLGPCVAQAGDMRVKSLLVRRPLEIMALCCVLVSGLVAVSVAGLLQGRGRFRRQVEPSPTPFVGL